MRLVYQLDNFCFHSTFQYLNFSISHWVIFQKMEWMIHSENSERLNIQENDRPIDLENIWFKQACPFISCLSLLWGSEANREIIFQIVGWLTQWNEKEWYPSSITSDPPYCHGMLIIVRHLPYIFIVTNWNSWIFFPSVTIVLIRNGSNNLHLSTWSDPVTQGLPYEMLIWSLL